MTDNNNDSQRGNGPQELNSLLKSLGEKVARADPSSPIAAGIEGRAIEPNRKRLIDAGVDISMGDPGEILFQHTIFCQCVMPYRDPGLDNLTWTRKNGDATLHMRAGEVEHPDGSMKPIGLPYGPKPRLTLMHINGEALRQQSRHIELEGSLTAFVRRIGLKSRGKNINAVREQLGKLAATDMKIAGPADTPSGRAQRNTPIVEGFDLWFQSEGTQRTLWPGQVVLGEAYFKTLIDHAVPLSETAVAALRNNTMALDMYTWLAQRLHRLPKHQGIPWPVMQEQFGQEYGRLRDFRRTFKLNMKKVQTVYPKAEVRIDHRGVQLYPSAPPISKRIYSVGMDGKK